MKTIGKGNVKGNPRIKHWANDYPAFWPRRGCQRLKQNNVSQNCLVHRRDSYARQSVPETIWETAVPRTAECEKGAADRADYRSRWSDCQTDSWYSKAAEALCAYQRVFWYRGKELRNRWTEKLLTKMHFHRGKGICQNSWRKWMRYPRRLRVPSLNKIAQAAARPSPLWGFCAANCFRDFIVASQNENPRWSGPSYLNRITGTRRSVSKGRLC